MFNAMEKVRKASVFGLALVTILAGADGLSAQCSDYVSTGPGQTAFSGHLKGTKTVSMTVSAGAGGSGVSITETFQVGYYTDYRGTQIALRCDTWEPYLL